jgi:hypothetical protein
VAGTAPVVFVGEPGTVRFLADQVEAQIGARERLLVDIWLRDEAGIPGQRWALKKEMLLLLYGVGDIERGRVCGIVWSSARTNALLPLSSSDPVF